MPTAIARTAPERARYAPIIHCSFVVYLDGQDADLVRQFSAQADATYNAILADLAHPDVERSDLIILARQSQRAQTQDYFHSSPGRRVLRETLERVADRDETNSETAGEPNREAGDKVR